MNRAERRRAQKQSGKTSLMPFSNRLTQHMSLQFHATRDQLKKMEEEIWADAWTEAEEWANVVNSCTLLLALASLYGFSRERMLKVIKTSNEYVRAANEGKMSVSDMIQELESKHKIMFDDRYKELVRRYSL